MLIVRLWVLGSLVLGVPMLAGCGLVSRSDAQAQSARPGEAGDERVSVETAIAQTSTLEAPSELTGTTEPIRQVSVRAQTEGQLLSLAVDVGDRIAQGTPLGQVDDRLLRAELQQADAELAARRSAVAEAEAEVSDVQAQADQAAVQLQQAIADAERFQQLAAEGAVTTQQAEQAQTARLAAEQALRSAQERVRTREQAVIAAQAQVSAQLATLAEIQQRRTYASLTSPIGGAVLERLKQTGDLVRPGEDIVRIGDFSAIKIVVPVSELQLGDISVGQAVSVQLDAFPDRPLTGQIDRIAPAADPTARLIPVEVRLPNPNGRITAGLLARVTFADPAANQIVIPDRALGLDEARTDTVVFVLDESGETPTVTERTVELGDRANGQVEILSGLEPGEAVVIRSSASLQDGQPVNLSLLSETSSFTD